MSKTESTADPYAGIDLPKPPRGYRLAKWGECGREAYWLCNSDWVPWGDLEEPAYESYAQPEVSIFAVPKPRIRIELEHGEEVE